MDQIYNNPDLSITVRNDEQCFIKQNDKVYAMSLRTGIVLPQTTVPVHVIDLPAPLTIVPEPVLEFTIVMPLHTMNINDLVVLTYKVPCCVGFIKSIDLNAHTATILPIAVNMSRGAIVFVDILPETPDGECLYILKSTNSAYAFWDEQWHCVGVDITSFQKALDIHINNQALHVTPTERKRWSSGGNFVGTYDTYAAFTASDAYGAAAPGDFAILRHGENDTVAIYSVVDTVDDVPQWYRAHLWDNIGGKYVGAFSTYNLLPDNAAKGDFALVNNDFYIMAAKWELSHALQTRDFTAFPIRSDETDDSIVKIHQIVDSLESHSTTTPLSANMGRELKERSLPPNAWEHLFNFGFNRSTTEASQTLFSYDNTGATNLLSYTYNGVLPKWASVCWQIKDDVALVHRSGSIYLRLEAKTADTASFWYGDYLVDTDINMLGILWIYRQQMYTPPFLLLPGMRIRAGLCDPHENQWPVVKETDTGEHKLAGSIKLYLHNA